MTLLCLRINSASATLTRLDTRNRSKMSTNNPYAPPNAESGQAIPAPVPQGKWLKGLIPLQFVVLVFAIGFAAWNIESIMVSGPILSLIGIIIGGFAGWFRNWLACLYGVSALTLALFVFALIFFNQWDPIQASKPVLAIGLIYGFAALPVTLFLLRYQSSIARKPTDIGVSDQDEQHHPVT